MFKSFASKLFLGVLLSFVLVAPKAWAFQFPTFDISSFFQGMFAGNSQVNEEASTAEGTVSTLNTQQALGDKLGGLQKLKNLDKIKEKIEKKQEKINKRIEKLKKMKADAEKKIADAKKKIEDTKKKINDVKTKVTTTVEQAKSKVEEVKGKVNEVKNKVTSTVEQAKNTVEQAKNTVEDVKNKATGIVDEAKNKVEGVKDQFEGYKEQALSVYNQERNKIVGTTQNLFGDSVTIPRNDEFDFEEDSFDWTEAGQSGLRAYDIDEQELDDITLQDLWQEDQVVGNVAVMPSLEKTTRQPFGRIKDVDEESSVVPENEVGPEVDSSGGALGMTAEPEVDSSGGALRMTAGPEVDSSGGALRMTAEPEMDSSGGALRMTAGPEVDSSAVSKKGIPTKIPQIQAGSLQNAKKTGTGPRAFGKISDNN